MLLIGKPTSPRLPDIACSLKVEHYFIEVAVKILFTTNKRTVSKQCNVIQEKKQHEDDWKVMCVTVDEINWTNKDLEHVIASIW